MKRFERQAHTYDQVAEPQRRLAQRLGDCLAPLLQPGFVALELGCGTGALTRRIAESQPAAIVLVDESQAMLDLARQAVPSRIHVESHLADAETWTPQPEAYELLASSALVQWLGDLTGALRRWSAGLRSGGTVGIATFGPGTLYELHDTYRRATGQLLGVGATFRSTEQLVDSLRAAGLTVTACGSERCQFWHATPREFLRSLRHMGVTPATPTVGPSSMRQLLRELEAERTDAGIPCTWELVWTAGRRP